jgi:transposase
MEITDGGKLSPSARGAVRRKAVHAVITGKMTQTKAAEIFGVTRTSVCLWVKAYRLEGEEALRGRAKGRPVGGTLTKVQEASIRKSVLGKNPGQSRVRYWLEHKYPEIERQAAEEKGKIWWVDETGLRSTHQTGTTWGKKGVTPLVRMSGERFGCDAVTAITNQGSLSFMVFEDRFTVPVFLDFLERLVKQQAGQKIFLIVDRHSVHKSSRVEKWLASRKGQIELFFLPAYSPELNPDELVNQDVKRNLFRTGRAKTKPELMKKLRGYGFAVGRCGL